MKNNRYILLLLLSIPLNQCFSQSVPQTVVSSAGDHFANSNVQISWTLGEISAETFTGGSSTLTQGFQQPSKVISATSVNELDVLSQIDVFPNPVLNQLNLNFNNSLTEEYSILLFDASGKLLFESEKSNLNYQVIDMSAFSAGKYILKLSFEQLEPKTYKIIK